MKATSLFLISAAVLIFSSVCPAQPLEGPGDSNEPVNLSDYLRYAALNNAELKAAFEQWRAAIEQVPQARPSMMSPKAVETPPGHHQGYSH